jgi:hypothetical protein
MKTLVVLVDNARLRIRQLRVDYLQAQSDILFWQNAVRQEGWDLVFALADACDRIVTQFAVRVELQSHGFARSRSATLGLDTHA